MTRIDETIKRHDKGYNCAQAIACTYCDLVGMDEETMFKVAEGLGLGVGCMEGTCGAVTGACLLAGCKNLFFTRAYTGEVIAEILSYLKEPVDVLPWEVAKAEYDKLGFGPGESEKHTLRI